MKLFESRRLAYAECPGIEELLPGRVVLAGLVWPSNQPLQLTGHARGH